MEVKSNKVQKLPVAIDSKEMKLYFMKMKWNKMWGFWALRYQLIKVNHSCPFRKKKKNQETNDYPFHTKKTKTND